MATAYSNCHYCGKLSMIEKCTKCQRAICLKCNDQYTNECLSCSDFMIVNTEKIPRPTAKKTSMPITMNITETVSRKMDTILMGLGVFAALSMCWQLYFVTNEVLFISKKFQ